MADVKTFVTVPSDDELRNRENWIRRTDDEYVAVRHTFLTVETRERKLKNGPAFSVVPVPVDVTVKDLRKRITTVKATGSVSQVIESTVSHKLTYELASAIKGGLKGGAELGAEFGAELQSRVGEEFVEELRTSFTGTKTYEVSQSEEESREYAFTVPSHDRGIRNVNKYVRLRPFVRDVYLVRSDVMTVRWNRAWVVLSVLHEMAGHTDTKVVPLFRVTWHEPETDYGMEFGDYEPEVDDDHLIEVVPLTDLGFAPQFRRPVLTELEELAYEAFPRTFEGKKAKRPSAPPARPVRKAAPRTPASAVLRGTAHEGVSKKTASKKAGASSKAAAGSSRRGSSVKRSASKGSSSSRKSGSSRSGSSRSHGSSRGGSSHGGRG